MNSLYTFVLSQTSYSKKKKHLYKLLFLLIVPFIFISSCKKEQVSDYGQILNLGGVTMVDHYYGFNNIKTDGEFIFESIVTNNDSIYKNTVTAGGFFINDSTGLVEKGTGPVSMGGYPMKLDSPGYQYGFNTVLPQNAFFGTEVTFSLTPPENNNIPVTESLYSPTPIYITNIAAITPLNIPTGSSTVITWNKDPANTKGIVISAEGNVGRSILVPDNGSYTLPWAFFSDFSKNTQINLWVERGNYAILQNGQRKYKIGGYSASAIWKVQVKP